MSLNCTLLVGSGWLLALAAVAGCPGPSPEKLPEQPATPVAPATAAPAGQLQLTIETAGEPVAPWQMAEATLVVENQRDSPVVIVAARLAAGAKAIANGSTVARHRGEIGPELVIAGSLFVDDPGPAARMPMPDRWQWRGEQPIATFSLLMPGQSRSFSGRFEARYEVSELTAEVRYLLLDRPDFTCFAKQQQKIDPLTAAGPGMPMGSGWTESLRVEVTYLPYQGIPDSDGAPGEPDRALGPVTSFPGFAMAASDFDAMAVDTAAAKLPLAIDHFSFDIDAARAAAGIAEGPYTRALAAEAWLLFDGEATHLISKDKKLSITGNAIPLADTLNRNRRQSVTVYAGVPAADPGKLAPHFARAGFELRDVIEKDGSHTGTVEVTDARLVEFLELVNQRKLVLDGDDAVK